METVRNKIKQWSKSMAVQWFIIPVFITFLLFIFWFIMIVREKTTQTNTIQEGIAEEIVRFHVIANSDSKKDQQLKIKVKDEIVEVFSSYLENSENIKETRNIIKEQLPLIILTAQNKIKEEGYYYNVNAKLGNAYFPTKTYGDMTFPPGIYEALIVEIGKAEGKNWWCVMYPPLCFVDGTYGVVPSESKSKLKHVLTNKEYKELVTSGKIKVRPKFKLKELIIKNFR